jgi:hypothetical protein
MADQAEVTKAVAHVATGQVSDSAAVSKVVAYLILVPGDSGPDTSNRQGHVHTQIIRR